MSLIGLAIIGRQNEPLYLCDGARILKERELEIARDIGVESAPSPSAQESPDESVDPLGIAGLTTGGGLGASLNFGNRLLIHSALDQLEESIVTTEVGLPVPIRGAANGGYLGVLSKVDEEKWVYGYITATNIKFLVLTESSAKEAEIRNVLSDIHEQYVRVSTGMCRDCRVVAGHSLNMSPHDRHFLA